VANSARCLLHLERDVERARELLAEAQEGLEAMGLEDVELLWGEALLAYVLAAAARRYLKLGHLEAAETAASEAAALGEQLSRLVAQTDALITLARIAHQRDDIDAARAAVDSARQVSAPADAINAGVRVRLDQVAELIERAPAK
jgi:hypothetical protein